MLVANFFPDNLLLLENLNGLFLMVLNLISCFDICFDINIVLAFFKIMGSIFYIKPKLFDVLAYCYLF